MPLADRSTWCLIFILVGVTTNSESGVISVEDFSAVFSEMEKRDLVLNLHGEMPSSAGSISLEEAFLPVLRRIHERHPALRIVLEHCSTKAALDAVRACGPTVAGSFLRCFIYESVHV
jgi:dihydroorotase